ncbi:MAG: hypothetical protein PHQ58_19670 [Rhodoferax sp.]|uniref:hypothetical protein n=1 Tax=Rhodoferax sp. TaxID=50421 RepID=UPI00260EB4D7|nr:hypothetical protein [Rhodoferax sp.]MDD2882646.1 hypothetical protein [Rhodoferax sp.]
MAPQTQQRHRETGFTRYSLRQTAVHLVWLALRMLPEARNGMDTDGLTGIHTVLDLARLT